MKKWIIPMCAIFLLATSCKSTKAVFQKPEVKQVEEGMMASTPSKESKKSSVVYNSSVKTRDLPTNFDVTKTIADLKVSPIKINYNCSYYGNDDESSRKAGINYAVNQALLANNADVLLELKYEIHSEDGHIMSVKVSGYPATYCNFRTATMDDLKMLQDANKKTQDDSETQQCSDDKK